MKINVEPIGSWRSGLKELILQPRDWNHCAKWESRTQRNRISGRVLGRIRATPHQVYCLRALLLMFHRLRRRKRIKKGKFFEILFVLAEFSCYYYKWVGLRAEIKSCSSKIFHANQISTLEFQSFGYMAFVHRYSNEGSVHHTIN